MEIRFFKLPKLKKEKQSLQWNLFCHMFILAAILLLFFVMFLFLFGHFTSTEKTVYNTLSMQAEVFDREMSSYYNSLAARNIYLSESITHLTQRYQESNSISFTNTKNSVEHIENLEEKYMELLSEELLKTDCSGIYTVLDTSRTPQNENSKAGVYIQRDMLGSNKRDALLLYRGSASLGKEKGIMPHRKWNLEFNKNNFPNYNEIYSLNLPLEKSCFISDITVLPGMSERIMVVSAPIKNIDGINIGICGFEVGESLFKQAHAQPTTLEHIICLFSQKSENGVNADEGLSCGVDGGYYLPINGVLKRREMRNGLTEYNNEHGAYVGITRDIPLCISNNEYEITVIIPKKDYTSLQRKSFFQVSVIVLLLTFLAIVLCRYFSKRYILPILKGLNMIKATSYEYEKINITEIDEIFDYLAAKSKSYRQSIEELSKQNELAQSTIEKLSYDRKKEICPDDYEYFLVGLKMLTPAEKNIFNLYMDGKTIKQIANENGIKETTVKFHNHNIYAKLGVTNKKQLLRFAAMYLREEEKNSCCDTIDG